MNSAIEYLAKHGVTQSWINAKLQRQQSINRFSPMPNFLKRKNALSACTTTAEMIVSLVDVSRVSEEFNTLDECMSFFNKETLDALLHDSHENKLVTKPTPPSIGMLIHASLRPLPWVSEHDFVLDIPRFGDEVHFYQSLATKNSNFSLEDHIRVAQTRFKRSEVMNDFKNGLVSNDNFFKWFRFHSDKQSNQTPIVFRCYPYSYVDKGKALIELELHQDINWTSNVSYISSCSILFSGVLFWILK